ncbi:MAG: N-acetylmuramoyl-L-alanine amidase [Pseudomonadota bacterium]
MAKAYSDHAGARLRPSPNHNERRFESAGEGGVDMLILHYTAMPDAERAVRWLSNPESEVSAHYMVYADGSIDQLVPESRRAWHAGLSAWCTGAGTGRDVNSRSIGIEIDNTGVMYRGEDADDDAPILQPAAYTDRQIEALIHLCGGICQRHAIAPRHVLGHSDVAPNRKQDPGEHFPWSRLHEAGIGHWVEPEPIGSGQFFGPGDAGAPVEALQKMLRLYGYEVDATGCMDAHTSSVITAFQRHFRPQRVDGIADRSTITTLHKLLSSLPSLS